MDLSQKFKLLSESVHNLTVKPEDSVLLNFYGYFKQAKVASGEENAPTEPGLLNFKGKAKYNAWTERKDLSAEEAMEGYVSAVVEYYKENCSDDEVAQKALKEAGCE